MALADVCNFTLGNQNTAFGYDTHGLMGPPSLNDALEMSQSFMVPFGAEVIIIMIRFLYMNDSSQLFNNYRVIDPSLKILDLDI